MNVELIKDFYQILIVSTYTEGTPPESAKWLYEYIKDTAEDFRVQHSILKGGKVNLQSGNILKIL